MIPCEACPTIIILLPSGLKADASNVALGGVISQVLFLNLRFPSNESYFLTLYYLPNSVLRFILYWAIQ